MRDSRGTWTVPSRSLPEEQPEPLHVAIAEVEVVGATPPATSYASGTAPADEDSSELAAILETPRLNTSEKHVPPFDEEEFKLALTHVADSQLRRHRKLPRNDDVHGRHVAIETFGHELLELGHIVLVHKIGHTSGARVRTFLQKGPPASNATKPAKVLRDPAQESSSRGNPRFIQQKLLRLDDTLDKLPPLRSKLVADNQDRNVTDVLIQDLHAARTPPTVQDTTEGITKILQMQH